MINNIQKYQQNAVLTASPGELTLMLYNGGIKFCNKALEALEKKEMETAHQSIIKAQRIVEELYVTLNDDISITKEIKPLYEYIIYLLVEGNVKKDETKIKEAKELMMNFRDLWREVIKK